MAFVTDNFNRANEDPLSDGGLWSGVNFQGFLKLVNNLVTAQATAQRSVELYNVDLGSDQVAQVKLVAPRGGAGCVVRGDSAGPSYYYGNASGNGMSIDKIVSGNHTNLVVTNQTTVVSGDVVRLEVIGTTLRFYKNGVQVLSATDNSLASGKAGALSYYSAGSGGAGDLDDFAAWSYGAPGVPTILGPVYTGETVVNGLGSAGLYVELYKGVVLQATVQVDADGRWNYTFGTGLSTGDVLKARQKNDRGEFGPYSTNTTVQVVVLTPPAVLGGLYSGNTDIVGFARPGVTVEIFKNGQSQGSTAADGFGVFRYVMGSSLVTDDVYTAKQTVAGQQSSASPSAKVLAAPANTDTYKTNIFDTLITFDFVKNATDTDDIRRSVALILTQAAILGSSTHEIKNAMGGLFYQYAARIAVRQG